MPESFFQIERRKSDIIKVLVPPLFCAYFLVFCVILLGVSLIVTIFFPERPLMNVWHAIGAAGIIGSVLVLTTLLFAMNDPAGKLMRYFRGRSPRDEERRVQDAIDEAMVAGGSPAGFRIEALIIPQQTLNVLSAADFDGNYYIAVTEGAVKRLSASQLRAVMAQQVAHVVSGDCGLSTMSSVCFSIYAALFEGAVQIVSPFAYLGHVDQSRESGADDWRGGSYGGSFGGKGGGAPAGRSVAIDPRVFAVIIFSYLFCVFGLLIGKIVTRLLAMSISREAVDRADAAAIRLTRDPRSLAEALYILAYDYRGSELPGHPYMFPLFIVNPAPSLFDQRTDFWGELWGTHPPADERIRTIADIAHVQFDELKPLTIDLTQVKPHFPEAKRDDPKPERWFVEQNGAWEGPFDAVSLSRLPGLSPALQVRHEATGQVQAILDVAVLAALLPQSVKVRADRPCPCCSARLEPRAYESVNVLECPSCRGILVEEKALSVILETRRIVPSSEAAARAEALPAEGIDGEGHLKVRTSSRKCPACRFATNQMVERLFTTEHRTVVDVCQHCGRVWFDRDELEMLQYLWEKNSRGTMDEGRRTER